MPNELSQGQRKLVSAARALAARPQLVCMDEPAAGLDTNETKEFAGACCGSATPASPCCWSTTTWASCSTSATTSTCIDFGVKIAEGTPAPDHAAIQRGRSSRTSGHVSEPSPRSATTTVRDERARAAARRSTDLSTGYDGVAVVRDLDLHVDSGEIVALLGANGAGKTSTLLCVSALNPILGGDVELFGQSVRGHRPHYVSPATGSPTCSRIARCSSS